jgi:hypothetical protein
MFMTVACRNFVRMILFTVLMLCTLTLGYAQPSEGNLISGGAFNDANANGRRDPGEAAIDIEEVLIIGPSGIITAEKKGYEYYKARGAQESIRLLPGEYDVIPPIYLGAMTLNTGNSFAVKKFQVVNGAVNRLDLPYNEKCVLISAPKVLWTIGANGLPNGGSTITFTITNSATWPIGWIYVTPGTGTYTGPNPIQLATPLAPGASTTVTLQMTGLLPNTEPCFTFDFHSPNLEFCCTQTYCFRIPECDCFQILNQVIECLPNGSFQVNLTLQNLTPFNITKVWTLGQAPATVNPIVTNVTMGPGGTVNLSLNVTGANLGGTMVYIKVMFYDGGTQCCVKDICLEFPKCVTCDNRSPICYALRPTYDVGQNPAQENYNGPDWAAFSGKTVAAVTCYSAFTNDIPSTPMPEDVVFGYMNLDQYQCAPPALGQNWMPTPLGFHNGLDGPMAGAVPEWAKWTKKYMGNVFAITFDNLGNAYVAQTSCYNADYAPLIQDFNLPSVPGRNHVASPNEIADRRLHGRIFKIENGTGKVTIFNEDTSNQWNGLPSGRDPLIANIPNRYPTARPEMEYSDQGFPEVGDVTFDYDHNQIFATSMDDGKIYQYSMTGQKLSSFDPWNADTGATYGDGFALWDENIWAAKYHRGRVYFSRWREDFTVSAPGVQNEVWSVEISNSAPFGFVGTARLELKTPDLFPGSYGGLPDSSTAPVSDITFTKEGPNGEAHMILAERGMGSTWLPGGAQFNQMLYHANPTSAVRKDAFTNTYPHRSRLLKYSCDPATGTWALVQPAGNSLFFGVGSGAAQTNSGGGTDFDFDNRGCTTAGLGNRVWVMADAMSVPGGIAYGLQGLPLTGGNVANSVVQDLNGNIVSGGNSGGTSDKSTNGDVEIPCPNGNGTAGRVALPHFAQSPSGRLVTGRFIGNGLNVVSQSQLQTNGEVTFQADVPNGAYAVYITLPGHLVKRVMTTVSGGISTFGIVSLIPGDVDGDNEVGPGDFEAIISAFGSRIGESGYVLAADFDWDGEIGPSDFECLVVNFSMVGDQP